MTSASTQNLSADRDAGERQILRYLYACFQRAREEVRRGFSGRRRLCHPALWSELTELRFCWLEADAGAQLCLALLAQITKVPENLLPFAVRCRNLTVSNTRTVFLTPEIYVNQNVYEQLVDLMLEALRGARKSGCWVALLA